jgi:Flp pilus assembly protein TadD
LKQAEGADPTLAIVHNQLGVRYLEAGDVESARDEFSNALVAEPELTDALNNLGVLLAQEGNNRAAEALVRRAIESDASSIQGHINLGLILAAEGNLEAASKAEDEALLLAPANSAALRAKSQIEAKVKKEFSTKLP